MDLRLLVAEVEGELVARVSIRHRLNDRLLQLENLREVPGEPRQRRYWIG